MEHMIIFSPTFMLIGGSAPWLWRHVSPVIPVIFAYIFAVCISSFIHASATDPGVSTFALLVISADLSLSRYCHDIYIRLYHPIIPKIRLLWAHQQRNGRRYCQLDGVLRRWMFRQNIVKLVRFGDLRDVIIAEIATIVLRHKIIIAYGSTIVSGGGIIGTFLLSLAVVLFWVLSLHLQALGTVCDISPQKAFRLFSQLINGGCRLLCFCTDP